MNPEKEIDMLNEAGLLEAIKQGDEVGLSKLLDSVGNCSELFREKITDLSPTNHAIGSGMTLLQFASFRTWKEKNLAPLLIERGAKVDLHSAAALGMTDRIDEILSAQPEAISHRVNSYFPAQMAITSGCAESIDCLAKHGEDFSRDLAKVAYFGWEDEVQNQEYTPWKPIHMASLWGFDSARIPVVKSLAAAGADLNAVSPLDGFRPIHLVAMPNRVDMIRFFVSQAGVDVDSRTSEHKGFDLPAGCAGPVSGQRCTALMVAAAEGFSEATKCLLELGANPALENDQGKKAIDFANNRFWKGQPYDEVIAALLHA